MLASEPLVPAKLPSWWAPHLPSLRPPHSSEALALKIGATWRRRQMGSGAPWPPASWLTAGWPGSSLGWQRVGQAGAGSHVAHQVPTHPWKKRSLATWYASPRVVPGSPLLSTLNNWQWSMNLTARPSGLMPAFLLTVHFGAGPALFRSSR